MTKAKERRLLYLWSFAIAFLCLLICSENSFLYPINNWVDAQALFSAGKGILHGNILYRDIYEHKGPFIYMLNAAGAWTHRSDMTGVFLLEVLSCTLFLAAVYRFLRLYGAGSSAYLVLPLVCMGIVTSPSFLTGGSAEEYALPMLAWSLYFLARWAKTRQLMKPGLVLLNGVLFGFVFWTKFTMTGFYLAWILIPLFFYIKHRQWKRMWQFLASFVLGFLIAAVPWFLYFGLTQSILPWLKVYLYDNIFVYSGTGASNGAEAFSVITILRHGKAILRCCIDWFLSNPSYSVPLGIGFLWVLFHRAYTALEKWLFLSLFSFTVLGIFATGNAYLYYGLVLASFGGLMALPFCLFLDHILHVSRKVLAAISLTVLIFTSGFCYFISPNTGALLVPRRYTLQYRIAAIVNQTPNATLLNYSAMDIGFYTACNIVPTVKYFHKPNVPLAEIMEEQNRYVAEGVTDYVVVQLVGSIPDVFKQQYELAAEVSDWSLYRLKSLGEN